MSQEEQDRRVDYIEFLATNIDATKRFYSDVFGWEFTDYGPDYTSFTDGRLAGGFSVAPEVTPGGPLVVALFHEPGRDRRPDQRVRGADRSRSIRVSRRPPLSLQRSKRKSAGGLVRSIEQGPTNHDGTEHNRENPADSTPPHSP